MPIHVTVPESQAHCHDCNKEAAPSTDVVSCRISVCCLIGFPYPLGDNLTDSCAGIVQRNGKRDPA